MKAVEFNIRGIKCDACDYKDEDVKFEDYKEWLNKPCPKCGANLLTEKDLKNTKRLMKVAEFINTIIPLSPDEDYGEDIKCDVEMDGTGSVKFKVKN